MKKNFIAFTCLIIMILGLAACQTSSDLSQEEDQVQPEDAAYPAQEVAYPVSDDFATIMEAAYPITEEDLHLLLRTWTLAALSEDGVPSVTPSKTVTFNADSRFDITADETKLTGNWSAQLFAVESTLILEFDSGEVQTFEIVDLDEGKLNLQTWRDGKPVEEGYLPAD